MKTPLAYSVCVCLCLLAPWLHAAEVSFRASMVKQQELQVQDVIEGLGQLQGQAWPGHLQNWVSQEQAQAWLATQGIETGKLVWTGPKRAWITRCYRPSQGQLKSLLGKQLVAQYGLQQAGLDVEFDDTSLPCVDSPINGLQVRLPQKPSRPSLHARLEIATGNGRNASKPIPIAVVAQVYTWKTKQPVAKGAAVTPLLLEKTLQPWSGKELAAQGTPVGLRFTRPLPAGEVLQMQHVEPGFAVNSGDSVKVILDTGRINIETKGRAMHDAGLGQPIRVRIEASSGLVEARVIEKGVVLVSV